MRSQDFREGYQWGIDIYEKHIINPMVKEIISLKKELSLIKEYGVEEAEIWLEADAALERATARFGNEND